MLLTNSDQPTQISRTLEKCKKYKNAKKFLNHLTNFNDSIKWEVVTFNDQDYYASIMNSKNVDIIVVEASSKKKAVKKLVKKILKEQVESFKIDELITILEMAHTMASNEFYTLKIWDETNDARSNKLCYRE